METIDSTENLEKENVTWFSKSSTEGYGTPKRAPLKNVNVFEPPSKTKSCYSPLTPILMKTPVNQRKSFRMKPSVAVYCDTDSSDPGQQLQKNLMKKHVQNTIKQTKEMYETQLSEKDSIIRELQEKLAASESQTTALEYTTESCNSTEQQGIESESMSQTKTWIKPVDNTKIVMSNLEQSEMTVSLDDLSVAKVVNIATCTSVSESTDFTISCVETQADTHSAQSVTGVKLQLFDPVEGADNSILPSDSELDRFVTGIIESCVQSIKEEDGIFQCDLDKNRDSTPEPIENDQYQSICTEESLTSLKPPDHSYCRSVRSEAKSVEPEPDVNTDLPTELAIECNTAEDECTTLEREETTTLESGRVCAHKEDTDSLGNQSELADTFSADHETESSNKLSSSVCEDLTVTSASFIGSETNTVVPYVQSKEACCSPLKHSFCEQDTITVSEMKDADTSMEQVQMTDNFCSSVKLVMSEQGTMVETSCSDANTSVAELVQFTDAGNSPVRIPGQDQGSMAVCDSKDADTSMQQISLADGSCSPVKFITSEQATMAGTESVDADTSMQQIFLTDGSCSPVKFVTCEQGTMAETEVLDGDTSMVHIQMMDEGSMAVPCSEEKFTMTDSAGSVNKETAMTPIKVSHKSGQRMTLQDIRSQHPRVVANHIDTLTLEVQRLKKEIHEATGGKIPVKEPEKRKHSSSSDSSETKVEKKGAPVSRLPVKRLDRPVQQRDRKASEEETRLKQQVTELSKKCEGLERELKIARQTGSKNGSQGKIDNEKTGELEKLKEQQEAEIESLKKTLATSQENNLKMEQLYQSTSTDFLNASSQLQILQSSVEKLQEALLEAEKGKAAHLACIRDMEENDKAAFLEIQTLNAVIKTQDQHLKEVSNKLTASLEKENVQKEEIKNLEDKNKELEEKRKSQNMKISYLKDEVKEYELTIQNLQRTIDFREDEIDRIEKELFNFREGYIDIESEMAKLTTENMELRESTAIMQGRIQELKSSYGQLQEVYQVSQTRAGQAMDMRVQEMTLAREELDILSDRMTEVLHNLKERVRLATQEEQRVEEFRQSDDATEPPHESLVSQILGAALGYESMEQRTNLSQTEKSNDSTGELQSPTVVNDAIDNSSEKAYVSCFKRSEHDLQSKVTTSDMLPPSEEPIDLSVSPQSKKDMRQEHSAQMCGAFSSVAEPNEARLSSAFAVVRDCTFQPKCGPLTSGSNKVSGPSHSLRMNSDKSSDLRETLKEDEDVEDKSNLTDYVLSVKDLFVEIIRVANMFETASQLSIGDLKEENEELVEQMKDLKKREKYLKAQIEIKGRELLDSQTQVSELEQSLQRMADNMMRFSNQDSVIKNLSHEIGSLRKRLSSVEGDKAVLEKHYRDLTTNNGGCSKEDAQLRAQILSLTRKNRKLQEKLIHQQEYFEDLETKAAARLKTLKDNWKKAENEVYRFDELVERIRETLERNTAFLAANRELKDLVRMIDGQSDFSNSADPLQPIKTAKF